MGRKPNPPEVARARGETRPSRARLNVVEFPAVERVPDPPEWMNADGQVLWEELAGPLFAQQLLTAADLPALGHLCQTHGEILDGYRRRVQPTAAQLAQLRLYFSEFGMTPVARTRVSPAGATGDENPFARNGKRPGGPDDAD